MKHFIYMDTDIVTSIVAQEEKGYIIQLSEESEREETKENGKDTDINVSVDGEANLLKLARAEGKLEFSQGFNNSVGSRVSTRDLAEKTLHDAAFDIAYGYVKPKKAMEEEKAGEEGECLEIQRRFNYVDFDYLENLFISNGVIDYIKKIEIEKIENSIQEASRNLNRELSRYTEADNKKKTNEMKRIQNQKFEEMHSTILAIRGLIPYSRMLISNDGFLIPLDDKYFRITPSSLGFRYGGIMTCVGMVTNIIGRNKDPDEKKNVFAILQNSVNEMLRLFLPTKSENICVIHPIAIYYGK